jgi:hypothetical protein
MDHQEKSSFGDHKIKKKRKKTKKNKKIKNKQSQRARRTGARGTFTGGEWPNGPSKNRPLGK